MSALGVFLSEFRPLHSRNRSTLSTLVLASLLTGGLGTTTAVAVAASPVCSRLVRTYVDRLERNVVSRATLKRWHDWGVGHPNWHPSLHARRPKFKKVRSVVASTEPIACPAFIPPVPAEVALLHPDIDTFLLPPAPPAFEEALLTPPSAPVGGPYYPGLPIGGIFGPGGASPGGPISGTVAQPPIGGGTPTLPLPGPGLPIPIPGPPAIPITPAPVPEPDNILLILAGMIGIALFQFQRAAVSRKPAPQRITPQPGDTVGY